MMPIPIPRLVGSMPMVSASPIETAWEAMTANGVYSSVIGEYGWITAIKDKGKSWEWRTETLGLVIMTNVGYRWRTDRITYSLGLLLGGYFGLSEKWWYLNESYGSTEKRDGTTTTTAYGMLEASVGYAF